MILTFAQASLLPFAMAALTAYQLARGLRRGVFHARGARIERGDALFPIYAYGLAGLTGAFIVLTFKFVDIAWFG